MTNVEPGIIATVKQLLEECPDGKISLENVRDKLGDRAFGFMLMVALVPSLLPIPGAGTVFGWLILLMGAQLVAGIHRVMVPGVVLKRQFDKAPIERFLKNHPRTAEYIQTFARPRHSWLVTGPAERIAGLFVILMAIPIILPMPLTNLLPAVAVFFMAAAIIQRDGLIALLAYIVGIISLILLTTVYGGLFFGLWMTVTKTLGMH